MYFEGLFVGLWWKYVHWFLFYIICDRILWLALVFQNILSCLSQQEAKIWVVCYLQLLTDSKEGAFDKLHKGSSTVTMCTDFSKLIWVYNSTNYHISYKKHTANKYICIIW